MLNNAQGPQNSQNFLANQGQNAVGMYFYFKKNLFFIITSTYFYSGLANTILVNFCYINYRIISFVLKKVPNKFYKYLLKKKNFFNNLFDLQD